MAEECHISDGINMGTIENDMKGYTKEEVFKEEIDDSHVVTGIDARERTFVNEIKQRTILQCLIKSSMKSKDIKSSLAKLKKVKVSPNISLVFNLLEYLEQHDNGIPEGYQLLLSELGKCTPISVLLPSHDTLDYKILSVFLEGKCNIFSDFEAAEKLTNAFPIITKIMKLILKHEKTTFLPLAVVDIITAAVDLKKQYNTKARDRAVPRREPSKQSVEAQVYPFYPAHTLNNVYTADSKKDKSEEEACNKDYNESSKFTGGITHLTCNHNIVKGFTAMKRGESVKQIVNPCVTRLPRRVQARRRFLIYDNACQARSYTERRFPHRVRHWTFLVDRKHWDNHTTCSQAYCMDEYPSLKHVNSQVSEQTNRSLRKLSVVLAYYGWENYLRVLELFLVSRNLRNKKLLV